MPLMTRAIVATLSIVAVLLHAAPASSQSPAVLEVVGRGAEGRSPYRGGGRVKFLSVAMPASIVHFEAAEKIPAKIEISHEVLQTAPILLDSRLGSEYWSLYNYTTGDISRLHSREGIDLQERGVAVAKADGFTVDLSRGPSLKKGLCGIRSRSYFLIVDAQTDVWLDVCDPNPFWHSPEVKRELSFTLANLADFSLILDEFASTWRPSEPFLVRLSVKDADGDVFPIPRAQVTAQPESAGKKLAPIALEPVYDFMSSPTGFYKGTLPKTTAPVDALNLEAKVLAQIPTGPAGRIVTARIPYGYGEVERIPSVSGFFESKLRRTADDVIETRAIWVHVRDYATPEATDAMIPRIKKADLNVVIPIVYVRGYVTFKTDKLPMEREVPTGFDPLAYLIKQCHAAGLEVHSWFCNAYFGAKQGESHGPGFERYPQFAVVGKDGKPFAAVASQVPADLHNPDYQKFNVDIMVDVARNYDVDGLHFDYIRTMTDCYCQRCREGFSKVFGHDIEEATDEEWTKWNQETVTKIVRDVSERARKIRKGIIMSAAVFANLENGARQGQNAPQWADAGYIDVVLPMDYTMDTFELRKNEQSFLDAMKDDGKLATGMSIYVRSGGKASSRDPSLVSEQLAMVRSSGIQGFSFFCYDYLSDAMLDMLRQGPLAEPAIPTFRLKEEPPADGNKL